MIELTSNEFIINKSQNVTVEVIDENNNSDETVNENTEIFFEDSNSTTTDDTITTNYTLNVPNMLDTHNLHQAVLITHRDLVCKNHYYFKKSKPWHNFLETIIS